MQKTEVLELGYFIDMTDGSDPAGFRALTRTVDDGTLLPCLWEDMGLVMEAYVPFVEIPVESDGRWPMSCYGLGFSQDFLERQGAACVDESGAQPSPEWRGTAPVRFELRDVQTVYVATPDEVSQFRMLYPSYQGTFVVLC